MSDDALVGISSRDRGAPQRANAELSELQVHSMQLAEAAGRRDRFAKKSTERLICCFQNRVTGARVIAIAVYLWVADTESNTTALRMPTE